MKSMIKTFWIALLTGSLLMFSACTESTYEETEDAAEAAAEDVEDAAEGAAEATEDAAEEAAEEIDEEM